jgi:hypothetical protein
MIAMRLTITPNSNHREGFLSITARVEGSESGLLEQVTAVGSVQKYSHLSVCPELKTQHAYLDGVMDERRLETLKPLSQKPSSCPT